MSRGSVFRKWDLHVHTPESFENGFEFSSAEDKQYYSNDIWEKYINHLERIEDIAVLGITDYFTIEGYKRVLFYKQENRLQNFDLILPNIEFRTEQLINGRRLNYHVIFSEEIDVTTLENEFLQELHIEMVGGESRILNRQNIEMIGKSLKKQHAKFKGRNDYIVGCQNISISLEEILRILNAKESLFGGKYLLVLPEEVWSSISWDGQGHLVKKNLLYKSDMIFSSNAGTRDFALGLKHEGSESFLKEFGCLKPCIHGSDAHNFEQLCRPSENRFCWIKADTSFEGLKQILYEPEDRVRIQPATPEHRKNVYTLDSVTITDSRISSDLSIKEETILLNKDLVAIVGGKGTGKTALLDLIANCFEDRCKRNVLDRNSFVQRIEAERSDLGIGLEFIGENIESFSKTLTSQQFCWDTKITYLPQGKIEEFSSNRQKLNEKIQEIVFGSGEIIEKGYKQKFEEIRQEIKQTVDDIDDTNREIYKLEEDTKEEIIAQVVSHKSNAEGTLRDKEDELKQIRQSVDKGVAETIDTLKEEEANLRIKHSHLEELRSKFEEIRRELDTFQEMYNPLVEELNLELIKFVGDIQLVFMDVKPQRKAIEQALGATDVETKRVKQEIEKKSGQLSTLSGVQKAQVELIETIGSIKKEIDSLDKQLGELIEKKERICALEEHRLNRYLAMVLQYLELRNYYKVVIDTFSQGKSQIMSGIDFQSNIHFKNPEFVELGLDILDLRKSKKSEIDKCADILQKVMVEDTADNQVDNLKDFVKKTLRKQESLKETRTTYDFYRWVFGDYFALDTAILFKDIPMDKLSIGQKGTVLLKLLLAEGDYPLIVDQPEENLDNKFIYEELVGAFRQAKTKRQVIIATNNANLVVNTDAEQIIVATYDSNEIYYRLGALENPVLRTEITTILEGGEEAFKKRERKYNIRSFALGTVDTSSDVDQES